MNVYPVYIQSLASIYPQGEPSEGRFSACEPDYKEWIKDAGLRRRMSRIVKMGVTAGLQCLQNIPVKPEAIITATGLGCLADTEKFLQSIGSQNEELLSPTPFIQSTFNTIGAQIALLSGNKAYNSTYVHRAFSFESALLDGMMRLQAGDAGSVLVGAVDELTPTVFHILERMGAWRKFPAGEGASFFLLGNKKTMQTVARLVAVDMQSGNFSQEQLTQKQSDLLQRNGVSDARIVSEEMFKPICGEYQTASSFGLWYACTQLSGNGFVLITNSWLNNYTAVLIEKFTKE
ncbi:beta-ketoacyl synthase chain length factor [Proteiniphilum acetatigenes]|uniref:beta-ketoacyl synthase chain length factor n=1 Tax=Proteiniphilum acetatigenes TaxID=294710 RepID=UPI00037C42CD|nr:beta-ketoacyl synthase chain length factor [Proteiniphilum acetatigenes]SFK26946.1 Beta-ketoacyl synthase, N-terminal domain [Porphyromonadaceae bacterium KH3CP3RA]